MNVTINEFDRRVTDVAAQLRTVQISFADDGADRRTEYLAEVLERALQGVLPDERTDFLRRLRERFPVWEESVAAPGGPPVVPAPAPALAPVSADEASPAELAERLIAAVRPLSGEARAEIVARLRAAGVVPAEADSASDAHAAASFGDAALPAQAQEALQYLMKQLEIDELDLVRTVKLMMLTFEYVAGSDQLVWRTWRTIAPRSTYRRSSELRKLMADYARGDRAVGGLDVKGAVDRLRVLTASLIAAVGQAGAQFARSQMAALAPDQIEAQVSREGGSLLTAREVRCWNLYKKLASDLTEENVEHAIKQIIKERAESLLNSSPS